MITIDKLKKNFGEKVAVDIEHYEINQGDMLGLVGNNGAGNHHDRLPIANRSDCQPCDKCPCER